MCTGGDCIDGKETNSSVARYINDSRGLREPNNVKFGHVTRTADGEYSASVKTMSNSVSIKNKPEGRELFIAYGREYVIPGDYHSRARRRIANAEPVANDEHVAEPVILPDLAGWEEVDNILNY